FGTVLAGNNSSLQETLTNTGGSSVTISQANVSGSGFSVSGVPATLAAGQSANFNVTFAPQSSGAVTGSVSIVSNASNSTLKITLSGTGTTPGVLSASAQTLSFGSVQVNSSTTQSETLTNTGGTAITVSQANVSGSGFSIRGLSLPLTLIAGQSFTFGATFAPTAGGSASGAISLSSDASNSTLTISLSGTGTGPPHHNVSLNWTSSTSTDVVGYNVYRRTIAGGPYTKINTSLNPTTAFVDNSVQAGQTYYYVTTAVDGTGLESAYSNQVKT